MRLRVLGHPMPWYVRKMLAYAYVSVVAMAMLVPFIWMLSTSLKTQMQARLFPPVWIPTPFLWDNYVQIWRAVPLANVLVNSVKISSLVALGQVLSCSLGGFAFARLRFRGRDVLFTIVLATLMVPQQVTLIPTFLVFRQLGWINTHNPLVVPYWFGGAFGVFLTRQFFLTIPAELADAAKVDGCNPFRIYWQIFMPLARPVLATLVVFTFLGSWNNLMLPLVYLRDEKLMTFPVALTWFGGQYTANVTHMMAASVVSLVPTLALFAVLQRQFVQGVVLSGLKA